MITVLKSISYLKTFRDDEATPAHGHGPWAEGSLAHYRHPVAVLRTLTHIYSQGEPANCFDLNEVIEFKSNTYVPGSTIEGHYHRYYLCMITRG